MLVVSEVESLSPSVHKLAGIIPDEGNMLLVDYLAIHHYPRQQLILYWRLKRDALHTSMQDVF